MATWSGGTPAAADIERRTASTAAWAPLGLPGEVDEIAVAAQFLADPENTYMTGHVLVVDGGWTAGYARDF